MTDLRLPARTGTLARALAGLAALVLAGCDTPSAPTVAAAPEAAAASRAAPSTPPGLGNAAGRSRACVRAVPSGSAIGRDGRVTGPDGSALPTPPCVEEDGGGGGISVATINSTIQSVYFNPTTEVSQFQSTWTVPPAPAAYSSTTTKFYALASVILPYYAYDARLIYFNGSWSTSVSVCGGGQCWGTNSPLANPGDVVRATLDRSACSANDCTWTMTMQNLTRGTTVYLSFWDARTVSVVRGAVTEGRELTSCSQVPTSPLQFTISVLDGNGQALSPAWTLDDADGVTPACGYVVNATATTATLEHNVPPPLQYSTATSPSPARQYNPFSITITGSGFDPATVQVQLVGPGQYASCPTYCTLLPSFSSKTSTQLVVYPVTLSIAGTYKIYVRNGPGGRWASNPGTITVNPMY